MPTDTRSRSILILRASTRPSSPGRAGSRQRQLVEELGVETWLRRVLEVLEGNFPASAEDPTIAMRLHPRQLSDGERSYADRLIASAAFRRACRPADSIKTSTSDSRRRVRRSSRWPRAWGLELCASRCSRAGLTRSVARDPPKRSSWSCRIRGHGDFESLPAIPGGRNSNSSPISPTRAHQGAVPSASASRRTLSAGTKAPASLSGAGAVRPSRKWSKRAEPNAALAQPGTPRPPFPSRASTRCRTRSSTPNNAETPASSWETGVRPSTRWWAVQESNLQPWA
jgi:hypothetical protein